MIEDPNRSIPYDMIPCYICGKTPTFTDSWFCYTTCAEHKDVPPAFAEQEKEKYESEHLRNR